MRPFALPRPCIARGSVLRIEPLATTHDRSGFDCGVDALNRYLQQIAGQHVTKGVSKTFVLVDESATPPKPILAFFSLSICQVVSRDLPERWAKRLPERIPAMRLGRLAVAKSRQGEGLGKILLIDAMMRVVSVENIAGGVGLFVDAKDEGAAAFYAKYGFEPVPGAPLTLFLPMATLRLLVTDDR
jgi:GNAT superfamily N-acetyltransferase